ncbi:MAG: GGDEF domain-containing protein [Burkholderiales bacterium]|nr:GGDEF domain-containing protein [Burkholderiales bacterium]
MNTRTLAPTPWQRLVGLLVTTDPKRRPTLVLCLVASGMYTIWMALIWLYIVPAGLTTANWGRAYLIHQAIALVVFYPLVRSGRTRRWADPGLVAPQIIWGNLALVVGYTLAPSMRPAILQTLVLIQMFGFVSLRPRATVFVGGATIAMLLDMLAIMSVLHPANFNLQSHTLRMGSTCFIVALLTWQSRNFSLSRQRLAIERRALASAVEKVQQIALHDSLTGLFNRQHIQARIDAERHRAERSGEGFSIALVDLDHFKLINDTHGHHVGDEALTTFARHARGVLRETDLIGRWGGEEFVIVMPATDPSQLATLGLDRLRANLAQADLSSHGTAMPRLRFSAGVAAWRPGETTEQLVRRADAALYQAKAGGRDRSVTAA